MTGDPKSWMTGFVLGFVAGAAIISAIFLGVALPAMKQDHAAAWQTQQVAAQTREAWQHVAEQCVSKEEGSTVLFEPVDTPGVSVMGGLFEIKPGQKIQQPAGMQPAWVIQGQLTARAIRPGGLAIAYDSHGSPTGSDQKSADVGTEARP